MDFLLTHDTIKEFALKYPDKEQKSCLAAAAIIGIQTVKNKHYPIRQLWEIANSMQSNSVSILKLQQNLDQLTQQVEQLSQSRLKDPSKRQQETPRFFTENSRRNLSEGRNLTSKRIKNSAKPLHNKRSSSFLKKDCLLYTSDAADE